MDAIIEGLRTQMLVVAAIFIIGFTAVGMYYYRRLKTFDDYILGGRGLPMAVIAASLLATNNSTGNVMGIPGMAYGSGFGLVFWIVVFCAMAYIPLIWLAPLIRDTEARTLPDYIHKRYGTDRMRLIFTMWCTIRTVLTLGATFYAVSLILQTIFGLPWGYGVIVAAVLTGIYTAVGGMWAVSVTDMIQWAIIIMGTAGLIPFLFRSVGSYSAFVLSVPEAASLSNLIPALPMPMVVSLGLGGSLWVLAEPALYQRMLGAKTSRAARNGTFMWVAIIFPWWLVMAAIGLYARADLPGIIPDQALLLLTADVLPGILASVVFVAIMAAAMSSADSYLNVLSAMLISDVYMTRKPDLTDSQYLRLARIATLVLAVVGMAAAPLYKAGILVMALFLQQIFIAAAVPAVVFGLLWKRTTESAAFWGSAIAGGISVIWALVGGSAGIGGIQPIIPALALGFGLVVLITLFGKPQQRVEGGDD